MEDIHFDIESFCIDHSINYQINKNWLNICCPSCQDTGFHGGFYIGGYGAYNCWKCGKQPVREVIQILLNCSPQEVKSIIRKYYHKTLRKREKQIIGDFPVIQLPSCEKILPSQHKHYLQERGFDWKEIQYDWETELKGTKHIGRYQWRIFMPVMLNNKLISWQARDITDKSSLKYITPDDNSLKRTFYGIDFVRKGSTVVVVEGIFDAWRLGKGVGIASFGTNWTESQVWRLLQKHPHKVIIMFDDEEAAQEQADKLAFRLSLFNVESEAWRIEDGRDPSDLTDKEVKHIIADF